MATIVRVARVLVADIVGTPVPVSLASFVGTPEDKTPAASPTIVTTTQSTGSTWMNEVWEITVDTDDKSQPASVMWIEGASGADPSTGRRFPAAFGVYHVRCSGESKYLNFQLA